MIWIRITLLLPLLYTVGTCAEPAERAALGMVVGEQRALGIPNLARYSPGGDAIRATSFQDRLMIKAIHPGASDLWVWKTDGSLEHRSIRVERWEGKPSTDLERAISR